MRRAKAAPVGSQERNYSMVANIYKIPAKVGDSSSATDGWDLFVGLGPSLANFTAGVFVASIFLAFQGGKLLDRVLLWIDARKERASLRAPAFNGNLRVADAYKPNSYKLR